MRPDKYILDENGEPQPEPDLMKWGLWFEDIEKRRVAWTEIEGVNVSTIFLGLDHNFSDGGPPILWESYVMGGDLDGEMRRYSSRAEALKGHDEIVEAVRQTVRWPEVILEADEFPDEVQLDK